MTTTPRLWKSETQVNTTKSAPQANGQIVGLDDGGYAIVWTDTSHLFSTGWAVIGQRFDAAGNKVGGEVKISRFNTGDDNVFPGSSITNLHNGTIAITYTDSTFGDDDTWVRVVNPSLGLVRNDEIDAGFLQTRFSSITSFANGSYVVSYTLDNGGGNTDIVAKIVSPAGFVGGPITVDDNGTADADFSQLATLSNNNFVDVWQRKVFGDHDIYFSIYTSAGASVVHVRQVEGAFDIDEETDPDVAALAGGGFVVAWADRAGDASGDGVRASIYNNAGALVTGDFQVNTSTNGNQNGVTLVGLADGGFVATWEDHSVETMRGQRFDALGHKIGVEYVVKIGLSDSRDSALLSDGRFAYAIVDHGNIMTSIWTTGWNAVASGDFNGDGTTDILWQNPVGTTSEWLMSPSGGIASFPFTPPAAGWDVVATGDLNGDGTDDIMWKNDATGSTAEWLMAPTGGASLLGTPAAPGWNVVATGDFNNDGTTDIMWEHGATGSTAEWLMAPTGGVGSMLSAPPVGGWGVVATGDFNGDGTDDVLWQQVVTGATSEWLMAGGSVASNPLTPAAPGWNVVATGDFNNDGTTDLMWKHAATGSTAEWLMAPTGGVGNLLGGPPVGGWNLIASGDFNGDGTDDVMWQNAATGATSEWLMAGGGVASNPFTPAAPGWNVVAAGDLNGDARIDLMWQNALTGATAEWLMAPGGGVGAFVSTLTA